MSKAEIERIDKYLRGKMSHKERLAFEAEVVSDKELASYLNIYRSIEQEMHVHLDPDENEVLLRKSLEKFTSRYFNMDEVQGNTGVTAVSSKYTIPPIDRQKDKRIKLWRALAVAVVIGII